MDGSDLLKPKGAVSKLDSKRAISRRIVPGLTAGGGSARLPSPSAPQDSNSAPNVPRTASFSSLAQKAPPTHWVALSAASGKPRFGSKQKISHRELVHTAKPATFCTLAQFIEHSQCAYERIAAASGRSGPATAAVSPMLECSQGSARSMQWESIASDTDFSPKDSASARNSESSRNGSHVPVRPTGMQRAKLSGTLKITAELLRAIEWYIEKRSRQHCCRGLEQVS